MFILPTRTPSNDVDGSDTYNDDEDEQGEQHEHRDRDGIDEINEYDASTTTKTREALRVWR